MAAEFEKAQALRPTNKAGAVEILGSLGNVNYFLVNCHIIAHFLFMIMFILVPSRCKSKP